MFLNKEDIDQARLFYIIYLIFSKPIYFGGFIILLVIMFNKVKTVIGSAVWAPLVELSFTTYLIHMFWIVIFFASNSQSPYLSMPELILDAVAILFTSFTSAMPFAFILVFPINNLLELILFTVQRPNALKKEFAINDDYSDKFTHIYSKDDNSMDNYKFEKYK